MIEMKTEVESQTDTNEVEAVVQDRRTVLAQAIGRTTAGPACDKPARPSSTTACGYALRSNTQGDPPMARSEMVPTHPDCLMKGN